MVNRALTAWQEDGADSDRLPRILDPACGAGAFLLPAFDELCRMQPATGNAAADRETAMALIREHLFGVDLDSAAIDSLRSEFQRRCLNIAPDPASRDSASPASASRELQRVLDANFVIGNAVTGPLVSTADLAARLSDRSPATRARNKSPGRGQSESHAGCWGTPLDWHATFPLPLAGQGFDIILGNPPYRREKDARQLFEHLAGAPLGQLWQQCRMDLWYYFLHRGLELLHPRGILCFVVPSYWMASRGASRLIQRLEREACFREVLLLDRAPVFAGVEGRHMVILLSRQRDSQPSSKSSTKLAADPPCRVIVAGWQAGPESEATSITPLSQHLQPQSDLFHNGRLTWQAPCELDRLALTLAPLNSAFETRQGIAENPPVINRRHLRDFPQQNYRLGQGVFVLTSEEVAALDLAAAERLLLRPYYETSALGRYRLPNEPTHWLLYLTPRTAPAIEKLPRLARHLAPYRPILDRRRETVRGVCNWWHLHWPRDEANFLAPRLLNVQMGREPQFVFADSPTYVGFSVNVVFSGDTSGLPLEALCGLLNSSLAAGWFQRHAKSRGVQLEIGGRLLQQFPLPRRAPETETQLAELAITRQRLEQEVSGRKSAAVPALIADIERQIDRLVAKLYGRRAA